MADDCVDSVFHGKELFDGDVESLSLRPSWPRR